MSLGAQHVALRGKCESAADGGFGRGISGKIYETKA